MAPKVWRGRSILWRIGLVLVAMVLAIALIVSAALATNTENLTAPDTEMPEVGAPEPALTALPVDAPAPAKAALGKLIAPLAADPVVGDLTGVVIDNATGEQLWAKDAGRTRIPASSTKLLTAMAAYSIVPADNTLPTTLARGEAEGELVVIPGGNVTTAAAEESTFFPGSDSLDDYVELAESTGETFTKITVAPGPYEGPEMADGWNEADIPGGYLTRVQPWMLDAGRVDPEETESPREGQPMYAAAVELGSRLDVPESGVKLSGDPVPVQETIGAIDSGPLVERTRNILDDSDNVGADALCHEAAMHVTGIDHADPVTDGEAGYTDAESRVSIEEATDNVLRVLRDKGIDTSGTELADCSGMSRENRISADVLAQVLHLAAGPEANPQMRALLDGLPIAAGSGTLQDRFGEGSGAEDGAGWVRAKTGTLSGVSSLAGIVTTSDGRSLSFALMSEGTSPADARPGLDRIASLLRECGCR